MVAVTALSLAMSAEPASAQLMDQATYTYVAVDELEYAVGPEERPVALSGQLWFGGDYNRLWLKADGERSTRRGVGAYEAQALYGRFVAAFWDAQIGLRVDAERTGGESDVRTHLVLGLQGLAPYWFGVESSLFVSQAGNVSARLEASYDLLFTQRLILEPELEANFAVQDIPEWDVGSGLGDLELGVRLRYEILRELAPYVGVTWHRRVGGTANFVRAGDGDVSEASFVAGLRAWW